MGRTAERTIPNSLVCQREAWSWREESNLQPAVYKTAALPIELRQRPNRGYTEASTSGKQPSLRRSTLVGCPSSQYLPGYRRRRSSAGRIRPPDDDHDTTSLLRCLTQPIPSVYLPTRFLLDLSPIRKESHAQLEYVRHVSQPAPARRFLHGGMGQHQ